MIQLREIGGRVSSGVHAFHSAIITHVASAASGIRRRPLTFSLVTLCIAGLIWAPLSLRRFFRIESRQVNIDLMPSDGLQVTRSSVRIDKGERFDTLRIYLSFSDTSAGDHHFTLLLPSALSITNGYYAQGMKYNGSRVDELGRWHYFDFTSAGKHGCVLEFKGEILSTSARELQLGIWIHVSDKQDEFPLDFVITGLDRSDVSDISPIPTRRNSYSILYVPLQWNSIGKMGTGPEEPILFQIRDRENEDRTEFAIFFTGILVGVLSSLLASICWDYLKEIELSRNRTS